MPETMPQQAIKQKKTFLQRIRDEYRRRCHEWKTDRMVDEALKKHAETHPGVPKQYQNIDMSEFKWTSKSFTLGVFEKIVKMIRDPEVREQVVRELHTVATGNADHSELHYVENRLGYTIYREVTGYPFTYPQYSSWVQPADIVRRNFLNLIDRGIWVYKKAPTEAREKFNKAVMPRVKKGKVVAPDVVQQQNVR